MSNRCKLGWIQALLRQTWPAPWVQCDLTSRLLWSRRSPMVISQSAYGWEVLPTHSKARRKSQKFKLSYSNVNGNRTPPTHVQPLHDRLKTAFIRKYKKHLRTCDFSKKYIFSTCFTLLWYSRFLLDHGGSGCVQMNSPWKNMSPESISPEILREGFL